MAKFYIAVLLLITVFPAHACLSPKVIGQSSYQECTIQDWLSRVEGSSYEAAIGLPQTHGLNGGLIIAQVAAKNLILAGVDIDRATDLVTDAIMQGLKRAGCYKQMDDFLSSTCINNLKRR